jgi:hypothetical protein
VSRGATATVARAGLLLVLAGLALFPAARQAGAAGGPAYAIKATWGDTNLTPGDAKPTTAEGQFAVHVRNTGDSAGAEEALLIADQLPSGVTATAIYWSTDKSAGGTLSSHCSGAGTGEVQCTLPASFVPLLAPTPGLHQEGVAGLFPSGYLPTIFIDVSVSRKAEGEGVNTATVSGGGDSIPASDTDQVRFSPVPSPFGIVPGSFIADVFDAAAPDGAPSRQAGGRPFEFRTSFDFTAKTGVNDGQGGDSSRYITSSGEVRTVEVTLPRGMIGNPEATPKCDPTSFAESGATSSSTACPSDTQVGYLDLSVAEGTRHHGEGAIQDPGLLNRIPIYNLQPPKGVPADFAFNAGGFVQGHIYPILDPSQNYAIKTVSPNISSLLTVRGTEATFWGVPADPAHDKFRYVPGPEGADPAVGASWGSAPIRPLLTNPTDCGFENGGARIRVDAYEHPEQFSSSSEYPDPLDVSGCDDPRFHFDPEIAMQPTDVHAGAPTGLDVHLQVPQQNDEVAQASDLYPASGNVKAIAAPPIKKAVVTLPAGMTISPSAAQGLGSCSLGQIGLGTERPVTCPQSSQYGTLTIHTPILPENAPPKGFIYVAKQNENPFNNFLALYLVIEEPERGILVKIPGRVDLDPRTGQIKTSFDDLPQFPVSEMELSLKGGVRAALVNPSTCGQKTIAAELFTWQDPRTPHLVNSSYAVTQKPDGSPCVNNLGERPFRPGFDAGTVANQAGAYSPFAMRLTRGDDDQELSRVGVTLPAGLAAKFAGVAMCTDVGIARAERRAGAGQGLQEEMDPSCPAASLIGSTDVGAGVGVALSYVPGKVYLAGPYKGAPLSLVVISPAVVGPFDLGVIAVRTALEVNPETAQGSAISDSFPQIFQGIPVRIRDLRFKLDRPDFILNPTSCEEKQIRAHVTGTGGDANSPADDTGADLQERFQAAGCASLGFHPKLALRLFGGTRRGAHPRLQATVTYPKGAYANIGGASVALPKSEFLDQSHIRTVCTRVQFAAKACPAGSIYGHAVAKTPLFDQPLKGPAYLRSSSHKLPDLVIALKGPASQPVEIDLAGRIDSVNGGIRNTFEVVPDAPVKSFTLNLVGGGKKGLLENSRNLCAAPHRATARFTGQNGKRIALRPALRVSCKKKAGQGTRQRGGRPPVSHPGRPSP